MLGKKIIVLVINMYIDFKMLLGFNCVPCCNCYRELYVCCQRYQKYWDTLVVDCESIYLPGVVVLSFPLFLSSWRHCTVNCSQCSLLVEVTDRAVRTKCEKNCVYYAVVAKCSGGKNHLQGRRRDEAIIRIWILGKGKTKIDLNWVGPGAFLGGVCNHCLGRD